MRTTRCRECQGSGAPGGYHAGLGAACAFCGGIGRRVHLEARDVGEAWITDQWGDRVLTRTYAVVNLTDRGFEFVGKRRRTLAEAEHDLGTYHAG